jgi:hypothetical protein
MDFFYRFNDRYRLGANNAATSVEMALSVSQGTSLQQPQAVGNQADAIAVVPFTS